MSEDWRYLLRWAPVLLGSVVLLGWGLVLMILDRRDKERERSQLEETKPAA